MTSKKGKDYYSHSQPPRWAARFLNWYCSDDLLEEVAGDIHEVFLSRVEELGIRKARRLYIWDVFKFFNYSTIRGRKKTSFQLINIEMIRNYFKIAIRSLLHQKESSFINIFGLGLGLTIIIFILLYTRHENSFDRFHSNFDKIYRVIEKQQTTEAGSVLIGSAAPPIGHEIISRYPDAIRSTSVANFGQSVVTIIDSSAAANPRIYNERDYLIADENFFQIFDFNFISGDKNNSLFNPKEVVLTERAALKYFGTNDVIGKTLVNNRTGELKVSGLVENPPKNSHLDFDFIISLATFKQSERGQRYFNSWDQNGVSQYILTDQPVEAKLWDSRMSEIASDVLSENRNNRSFQIQSLADIHYGSNEINYELNSIEESKTNVTYLKIFMWIGIVILLIASINYINLATARSLRRSREIGCEK
ncbi:MAG: ABC transporter permease [Saprospiraceae bacterium]|nr:ABC transporter permease [Saprospiraceae bacterium]